MVLTGMWAVASNSSWWLWPVALCVWFWVSVTVLSVVVFVSWHQLPKLIPRCTSCSQLGQLKNSLPSRAKHSKWLGIGWWQLMQLMVMALCGVCLCRAGAGVIWVAWAVCPGTGAYRVALVVAAHQQRAAGGAGNGL